MPRIFAASDLLPLRLRHHELDVRLLDRLEGRRDGVPSVTSCTGSGWISFSGKSGDSSTRFD